MGTLHLINKSPARSDALSSCMQVLAADDAVMLIEDGVYAALGGSEYGAVLSTASVSALQADVEARGLSGRLAENVAVIDDEAFVDLCTRFDRVMSWF